MQLRRLGRSGPHISVVGYGAWEIGGEAYGPNPSEKEVLAAIEAALDSGINWIDTAELYGNGTSEALVGKALGSRRKQVIVATKVAPKPLGTGFEPKNIRRAAEQSLARLKTDYIDLFQLHWWPGPADFPIEHSWEAMSKLMDDGLVKHIGVSNFDQYQIERVMKIRHCDSFQPEFSMLNRDHQGLIEWCGEQGIGVIIYGPLAYGLLSGSINRSTQFHPSDWRSGTNPDHPYFKRMFASGKVEAHLEIARSLTKIAERRGVSTSQLALAWVFHQNSVTAAIAGSRSVEHNQENAEAGALVLEESELEEIDQLLHGA